MTERQPKRRVVSIHVAVSGGAPIESTREAELVPGKGIVGDVVETE